MQCVKFLRCVEMAEPHERTLRNSKRNINETLREKSNRLRDRNNKDDKGGQKQWEMGKCLRCARTVHISHVQVVIHKSLIAPFKAMQSKSRTVNHKLIRQIIFDIGENS